MATDDWFLTAFERGNPSTRLDSRHPSGAAWSSGNAVQLLVHGAAYFAELARCLAQTRAGDLVMFADWRGDPDEELVPGVTVAGALCAAADRGVDVRGLVWRSHMDKLSFSAAQNRNLANALRTSGAEVLLDMRVLAGGSHHQKFVVIRHHGQPERDVAFVGGIDLGHSRRDDAAHGGDPQAQPMAAVYGPTPPWHDAMVALRGPAVADVETVFRERWEDPAPLTRNPYHAVMQRVRHERTRGGPLPPPAADPPPAGGVDVQLLRTYPARYPFAPTGERSIARAYAKALARARRLVYVEDQYLWSEEVAAAFAAVLRAQPDLHVIAVLPHVPDQDGGVSMPPNLVGRQRALSLLREAGGDRFAVYGIENHDGTPVYVHAKVCVVDDTWATVGSDNINRRSWTHDSELSAALLDTTRDPRPPTDPAGLGDGARVTARNLRLELAREHLDADSDEGLVDPGEAFAAFARSAAALAAW
ncbi:MAG: phospholipase D family protein, partial [Actinomycetota bacterium]|nr:phospholipase D family protein [Actinomycetota bacterium]